MRFPSTLSVLLAGALVAPAVAQDAAPAPGGPDGNGGTTGDLRFSDFTTVNLRVFANLAEQPSLVREMPWLRGTRVTLGVNNLFDSRLQVRDALGETPLNYQPDIWTRSAGR